MVFIAAMLSFNYTITFLKDVNKIINAQDLNLKGRIKSYRDLVKIGLEMKQIDGLRSTSLRHGVDNS